MLIKQILLVICLLPFILAQCPSGSATPNVAGISFTADNIMQGLYVDEVPITPTGNVNDWTVTKIAAVNIGPGSVVAIQAQNTVYGPNDGRDNPAAILAEIRSTDGHVYTTASPGWKTTKDTPTADWYNIDFDDSAWSTPTIEYFQNDANQAANVWADVRNGADTNIAACAAYVWAPSSKKRHSLYPVNEVAYFRFRVPQGEKGDKGNKGDKGDKGDKGSNGASIIGPAGYIYHVYEENINDDRQDDRGDRHYNDKKRMMAVEKKAMELQKEVQELEQQKKLDEQEIEDLKVEEKKEIQELKQQEETREKALGREIYNEIMQKIQQSSK